MNILKLYKSAPISLHTIPNDIENYINKGFIVYHLNPIFDDLDDVIERNQTKFGENYKFLKSDILSNLKFDSVEKKILIVEFMDYVKCTNDKTSSYLIFINVSKELKNIGIKNNMDVICNNFLNRGAGECDNDFLESISDTHINFDSFDKVIVYHNEVFSTQIKGDVQPIKIFKVRPR